MNNVGIEPSMENELFIETTNQGTVKKNSFNQRVNFFLLDFEIVNIGNGNCQRANAKLNCSLPYNNKVGEINANRKFDLALSSRDRVSNGIFFGI